MDFTILKKLGLTDKEISVYLKLLEYGAISVRGLADLTGLNRGTTYDVLKRLQEIGLVSFYDTASKQKFVAEEPAKLEKLLNRQEEEIKAAKNELSELIPELKSLQDKGGNLPTTKFYEGQSGIRFILEDLLSSVVAKGETEYYIYSATKGSDDINNAFPDFTRARIKKNIRVKAIALAEGGRTHGLDERRWLGTSEESATFILIYAGKCAFISRDAKNSPVGVLIENAAIFLTQKTIFLKLWEKLK
jgi:HTH-type transcriptional regulator, sugar sensing transcriptional regulator